MKEPIHAKYFFNFHQMVVSNRSAYYVLTDWKPIVSLSLILGALYAVYDLFQPDYDYGSVCYLALLCLWWTREVYFYWLYEKCYSQIPFKDRMIEFKITEDNIAITDSKDWNYTANWNTVTKFICFDDGVALYGGIPLAWIPEYAFDKEEDFGAIQELAKSKVHDYSRHDLALSKGSQFFGIGRIIKEIGFLISTATLVAFLSHKCQLTAGISFQQDFLTCFLIMFVYYLVYKLKKRRNARPVVEENAKNLINA